VYPWLTSPDGPFPLSSYFTLLTVGFMIAIFLAWRAAPRFGIDPDDLLDMSLYMFAAGLIGARILHVFADGYFWDYVHLCTDPLQVEVPSFIHVPCRVDADCVAAEAGELCHPEALTCRPGRDCFAAFKFWSGGLAFYGGFILAVAIGVRFIYKRGITFARMADLCAPSIAFGLIWGRAGCFLSGCCFGTVTESPLGISFPGGARLPGADGQCPKFYNLVTTSTGDKMCSIGSPAFEQHIEAGLIHPPVHHSLPVHPTQLYEAGFCLVLTLYLFFWRRKHTRFAGQVWWEMCGLYGLGRFVVEIFRNDDRGVWALGLSTSQIIALPIMAVSAWMLYQGLRRPPTTDPYGLAPPEQP
jgi:phosphatidylglycerol:prolipoprotein diacylglycerol transferase